jgi:hypothetical protein
MTRALVLAAGLLTVAGAASGQDRPRRDRNVITQDELDRSGVQNLDQAVRKLRPAWLSSRGAVSLLGGVPVTKDEAMVVYVDGSRRGGLPELELMPVEQVSEIRFMSADVATMRFGAGHPFGAIDIITRR